MSVPSTVRVHRSRLRRGSAAAVLVAGLVLSGTAVVSAGAPMPSAPTTSAASVVGLKKGAYGDNVRALQEALNRVGIGVKYGVDGYFGSATQASVKAFQNYKEQDDPLRATPDLRVRQVRRDPPAGLGDAVRV